MYTVVVRGIYQCHLLSLLSLVYIYIWLVVWNILYFSIYWECHHPNWLIFFRGVETINHLYIYMIYICDVEYNRWCGYIISSSPSPLHSWCQLLSWRSFGTLPLASWGQSDGDVQGRQGVCFWGIWECLNWLVVSNMFYFPFHIWDIILPINIFQDGYCTTNQ